MKVVVNAMLRDGTAGGVQQSIAVLARALDGVLPAMGETEVEFLTVEDGDSWLKQEISSPKLSLHSSPASSAQRATKILRKAKFGRTVESSVTWVRDSLARPESSTGRFEERCADIAHFPYQRAEDTSVPTIYQPWDLQHRHLPGNFSRAARRHRETTMRAYCESATAIVVPSSAVADDIVQSFGVRPEKISVIAPYVSRPIRKSTSNSSNEAPYLLFPGRTWLHKNHEALIEALARTEHADLRILCTGAPTGREAELMELATSLAVESRIEFRGFVESDVMDRLLAGAQGLILPTLFEGWGYPVLEGFDAGVPVACSDIKWLDPAAGRSALRFNPRDSVDIAEAMSRLWVESASRSELIASGAERVSAYSASLMGYAYLGVYEGVSPR